MDREKIDLLSEFHCSFRVEDEKIVWVGDNPPTQKQIDEKIADYDSKKYQRDRLAEYPSIQELVVALYDESDKASIIERRKAVKAKYPKPK
tara:strand:+ start:888 stop:1160 length:273 start_codon:yes stop_codon:yes gene_type:complete